MYQGDSHTHEAQPQDDPENEAQEEICAQDKIKNLMETIEEKEAAILDLTEKLNLEIKLGCDSGEAWQRRFSALEEESDQKQKASDSKFRATIQEKEEAIVDLTEKLNLEIKLRSDSESNTKVLYLEKEYLKVKGEILAINLAAQTQQGHDSDEAWQLRFSALEEESDQKKKASDSKFRATILEKEEAILDLTEKLNLEIKLRSDSESNAKVLYLERESQKVQAESLAINLAAQTYLGCERDKAWQRRFSALEEESDQKEKASDLKFRATIQEKEEAIMDLTEKLNLEIKLRSDRESNTKLLYSEREYLKNKVESLAINLAAQTQQGHDSGEVWQLRFSAQEEESDEKEKAFDLKIQEKEEAILHLIEKLNLEIKLRSDSESNAKVLYSEREYLKNKVESLAINLAVHAQLGHDSSKAWQRRFSAMEEDLKAQTKLVSDNDKAWKDKISALKQECALKEKTIQMAFHVDREALLQKLKEQSCKVHSLQVKCEFQGAQNNHEEEIRSLRRQIVNLEDICLMQKKKNLGFFGRRMEDREVELERMKRNLPAREPVDPPDDYEEEE